MPSPPEANSGAHQGNYRRKGEGKFDYDAVGIDEVSLKKHEQVTVHDSYEPGWVRVDKLDGSQGLVPENYLRIIHVYGSPNQN